MNTTNKRLNWLGKALVLGAVVASAVFYVSHTHQAANPPPRSHPAGSEFEIDLNMSPEVVEFEGFINYGSPINTTGVANPDISDTIMLSSKNIGQPVFSTRKLNPSSETPGVTRPPPSTGTPTLPQVEK